MPQGVARLRFPVQQGEHLLILFLGPAPGIAILLDGGGHAPGQLSHALPAFPQAPVEGLGFRAQLRQDLGPLPGLGLQLALP